MSMKRVSLFLMAFELILALGLRECRTATGAEGAKDAGPRQAQRRADQVTWGNPVAAQVISVTSEKAAYACGEPIFLTVRLKNTGRLPVFYPRARTPRMDYTFDVSLPYGTSVTIATAVNLAAQGGVSDVGPYKATLRPGAEFAERVRLNAYRDFGRPGKYIVSARKTVALPSGGFSSTEAVSNKCEFSVVDIVAEQLKKQGEELKGRRTLSFSKTWITNDALEYLDGLMKLEELRLCDAENITDAGLDRLKRLPALEKLDVSGTRITDAALNNIKRLAALKTLDVSQTKISDAGLEHLRGLPCLESLELDDDAVTDAGLRRVGGLTKLRMLCIGGTPVTDAGLQALERLTELECLDITHTKVGDAGLAHLKGLVKLEWLCLGGTRVTDEGLMHVKVLSKLKQLELYSTCVTDAGVEHLNALAELELLHLGDTRVTDAALAFIKARTSLESLYLERDAVTDAGMDSLKGLTKLGVLNLSGTQVTDAGLERLRGLTSLHFIDLSKTRVTSQGVAKLKQALPKCTVNFTP